MHPNYPWADRRNQIEYGGLRMEVTTQSREGGHRHQVHQYLGYDDPYTETFGLKAGTYSFVVTVAGDDYDELLREHIRVFETVPRGRLSLWHGKDVFVVCRRWRIAERSDAAGLAKITVDFVDAGLLAQPLLIPDAGAFIGPLIDLAKLDAAAQFADVAGNVSVLSSLAAAMGKVAASVSGALTTLMDKIDAAKGLAEPMATRISGFVDNVESLAADAEAMADSVNQIYDDAMFVADLAKQAVQDTKDAVKAGKDAVKTAKNTFASMQEMTLFGDTLDPVPEEATTVGQKRAANQLAMGHFVEQVSALHLADLALRIPYTGSREAAGFRDALAAAMDRAILSAGNANADALYIKLRSIKAATVTQLDATAARLPTSVVLELNAATPSLVLAYKLYGSTARAGEITAANAVRHPGFVPPATALDVLSPAPEDL